MSSTYLYLSRDDLKKLSSGKSVEIPVTEAIRHSHFIFLKVDTAEKEAYDEKRRALVEHVRSLKANKPKVPLCNYENQCKCNRK